VVIGMGATDGVVMLDILTDADMRKQVSMDESGPGASVGTLARGLDVLALFGRVAPELSQKEMSDALGLPMPTIHRLTRVLSDRGYLARDPASRRFRLGLELARLMPALLSGLGLPELARAPLRALAEHTGETVNLALLDRGEAVYLVAERGDRLLTTRASVGLRLPAHCVALGKCLLAQLPDAEARAAAGPEPYAALTPHTVTRWRALRAELERVRRDGVAHSREEFEIGLASVAVPLAQPGGGGRAPAAINVSLPTARATPPALDRLTAGLRETAAAIAAATGGAR
jgi:DNA-binding IclR family transcriptional regulator